MSELKIMAAQAALTKMLADSHFSICTVDRICEMLGVKPDREAYDILHTLHCVHYNQMPRELMAALPELIQRVVNSPAFDASRINIVQEGAALRLIKH